MNMSAMLSTAKPGDSVRFAEEKQKYTVQAIGRRYVICTKPFNPRRTVLYTVVDLLNKVRGTENLILGRGAETRERCESMLARLEGRSNDLDFTTEISRRNRIPLDIISVIFLNKE